MNLKKIKPERALTWGGKSIAVCSRKELIDCIIHLAAELAKRKDENVQPTA